MIKLLLNYFIKPILVAAPFYIGYRFYAGDYNDILMGLMIKKIKYELYLNHTFNNLLKDEKEDENEENQNRFCETFLYYDGEKKLYSDINKKMEKISTFPLKLFIRKNENNKKFSIENLPNKIDKPFMQVEILQNEQKFTIYKGLSDFYYKNNKIFDEVFLKWFLDYYKYDFVLEDDYVIKIMDNDINFVELSKNDYIILTDNGFKKNYINDKIKKN